MKKDVLSWMKILCEEHDPQGQHSIVAVIFDKRNPIAIGYNQYKKSHPLQFQASQHHQRIFLHAEIDAYIKASKKLDYSELMKCTMGIMRVRKDGSFGLARPCKDCMKFITPKMKKISYTIDGFCDNIYSIGEIYV